MRPSSLAEAALPPSAAPAAPAALDALPDPLWKRPWDVLTASVLLAATSPLWLAISLAIKLTSPGPALYVQDAVGRGGRTFRFYKFRTMRAGADSTHHRQYITHFVRGDRDVASQKDDALFKMRDDQRVTPLGRLLRRTSLDELPQLINVLKGDMSLVGPRPPLPYEHELYDAEAKRRLAVRPGITGLCQVTARSRLTFRQMVELDLDYIRRRSLGLDLLILLRTVPAALLGRGAC